MSKDVFPVNERNRVKRAHERGSYDRKTVYTILDSGIIGYVAYVVDNQPYCTPTIYWREEDHLYWHGSSASRMLKNMTKGTPVCVTVSHLDGLVLARAAFEHSLNYRSVMCFGKAYIVDDPARKEQALHAVVDRLYPDRAKSLRPITAQESKATMIIGMKIEQASAKVRNEGATDNEEDYALPLWAGVIPIQTVIGTDEPCPRLLPEVNRPDNLSYYRSGRKLDEALIETQNNYMSDFSPKK